MIFLDTNIIIRFLTWDDPRKAKKCEKLFKRAVAGKEILFTSTLVIAELVWILEKAYKCTRTEIAAHIQKILNTPNIITEETDVLIASLGLYGLKNIDFIDAYNAILMESKGIKSIYSFDKHFDIIPPLKRLEP